jgi:hypothetical protein
MTIHFVCLDGMGCTDTAHMSGTETKPTRFKERRRGKDRLLSLPVIAVYRYLWWRRTRPTSLRFEEENASNMTHQVESWVSRLLPSTPSPRRVDKNLYVIMLRHVIYVTDELDFNGNGFVTGGQIK